MGKFVVKFPDVGKLFVMLRLVFSEAFGDSKIQWNSFSDIVKEEVFNRASAPVAPAVMPTAMLE